MKRHIFLYESGHIYEGHDSDGIIPFASLDGAQAHADTFIEGWEVKQDEGGVKEWWDNHDHFIRIYKVEVLP